VQNISRSDVLWVAAAPLFGLVYALPLWLWITTPEDGYEKAIFTLSAGNVSLPIGAFTCVYLTYAWLADGEHTLATYARLWGERPQHGALFRTSLLFFALGPVLLLLSAGLARVLPPSLPVDALLCGAFLVLFQLWGFFHINRQHFGFYGMYRAKEGGAVGRGERWLVHALLFLPLGLLLTDPGLSSLPGLDAAALSWIAAFSRVRPIVQVSLIVLLLSWGWREAQQRTLFGPRSLLLLSVLAMHLVVFTDLRLAACMTPIIGLGHCIQYHFIVYRHGRRQGAPSRIFRSPLLFYGTLVLLSFCLYRGPLTEWVFWALGGAGASTTFTALEDPAALGLGQRIFGLFLMGWGLQHYFLDGFIWRKRRQPGLAGALGAA